jgi:hypothetical protein
MLLPWLPFLDSTMNPIEIGMSIPRLPGPIKSKMVRLTTDESARLCDSILAVVKATDVHLTLINVLLTEATFLVVDQRSLHRLIAQI